MIKKIKKLFSLPTPRELGWTDDDALPISKTFGNPEQKNSWEEYRILMKEKYPIRYFLIKTFPLWFYVKITMQIKELLYWIKCHIMKNYRFHLLDLRQPKGEDHYSYGYMDPVNEILYANFAILVKFVKAINVEEKIEKEMLWISELDDGKTCKNQSELDRQQTREVLVSQLNYSKQLLELYNWWVYTRKEKLKELSYTLTTWHDIRNDCCPTKEELFKKLNVLEKELEEETQDKLHQIINLRMRMWD